MRRLLPLSAAAAILTSSLSAAPPPVQMSFDFTGLPLLPFGGEYLIASTVAGVVTGAEVRITFSPSGGFDARNLVFEFAGPSGGVGPLIGSSLGWSGSTGTFTHHDAAVNTLNGEIVMQGAGPTLSYWFLNISPTADSLPTPVQGTLGPTSITLTVQPCLIDWNGSFNVSVQDLFDFLGDYFASSPRADIDGSGDVGIGDIFRYLSLYFSGCDAF